MKAMVQDVHNDTQSSKYWPTINAYWPLLKRNELIKDLQVNSIAVITLCNLSNRLLVNRHLLRPGKNYKRSWKRFKSRLKSGC